MKVTTTGKVQSLPALAKILKTLKSQGKTIVLCHGVFDLVHPGHIRLFHAAKKQGDILVVAIIADDFVKKGPGSPAFRQELRCEVLSAIEDVDYIAVIRSDSSIDALTAIGPHIFVKGRRVKREEEALASFGGKIVYNDEAAFSSTRLINAYLDIYPPETKAFIGDFRKRYSSEEIVERLESLRPVKVMIIGDAIIDQYVYSSPMGKSTKEPIVVHKYLREESYAGGSLATANNVAALCDRVTLVTALGRRKSFTSFIKRHMRPSVKLALFYQQQRKTIVKRRYIDYDTKQKLFQVSYIQDDLKVDAIEASVVSYLKRELPKYDLVIVNDFGHGFLTKKMIRTIYAKAAYIALNVQANSANYGFNIITKYPRANFVCIDEQEIRLAMHDRYAPLPTLIKRIYTKMKCQQMIITRGKHGSNSYSSATGLMRVPALTEKVIDRVGAGDALFAMTSPCVYKGMDLELVTFIGNVAGSIQVATIGNKVPIARDEMMSFIIRLLK